MTTVQVNIENGSAFKFWGSVVIIEDIDKYLITYKNIESGKVSMMANTEENRSDISRKPVNNIYQHCSTDLLFEIIEFDRHGKNHVLKQIGANFTTYLSDKDLGLWFTQLG